MPVTLLDKNQDLNSTEIMELLGDFKVKCGEGPLLVFPKTEDGADGRIGKLNVSKYVKERVHNPQLGVGGNVNLAIHVTFEIPRLFVPNGKTLKGNPKKLAVQLTLKNLHVTARPLESQETVSAHGSSKIQQTVSTHRGRDNKWKHADDHERMANIAQALGFGAEGAGLVTARGALNAALADYEDQFFKILSPRLEGTLVELIQTNLLVPESYGAVDVTVNVTYDNW